MDKPLKERLEILKQAGEISDEIMGVVIEFIKNFEKKYSLEINEENGSMLITHLSMALARIKRGEEIDGMDESVLNEIKQNPIYGELPEFYDEIEKKLQIKIPDSERGFIAAHGSILIDKCK
ncbi:PRD domain-containing protein [Maledivibacter halophilus]|uniref:Transcriptional antiterminator n=1 Tax=Maledivibacter halophilus TaxID=36842 RepID=A0A1T5M103_9FIRM|nr:PRD domain-containing protein [Maledivibacter halophilus]SKC81724.1 Transcriptional antiterminator [Maledivibacter halophilus]